MHAINRRVKRIPEAISESQTHCFRFAEKTGKLDHLGNIQFQSESCEQLTASRSAKKVEPSDGAIFQRNKGPSTVIINSHFDDSFSHLSPKSIVVFDCCEFRKFDCIGEFTRGE